MLVCGNSVKAKRQLLYAVDAFVRLTPLSNTSHRHPNRAWRVDSRLVGAEDWSTEESRHCSLLPSL
jgi:hypothetical protein